MNSSSISTASDGKAGEKNLGDETPIAQDGNTRGGQMALPLESPMTTSSVDMEFDLTLRNRLTLLKSAFAITKRLMLSFPRPVIAFKWDAPSGPKGTKSEAVAGVAAEGESSVLAQNDNQPASLGEQEAALKK